VCGKRGKTLYYTYILKSTRDDRYYYGSTSNLKNKLKEHNSGKVKSTKSRRPLLIHYYEEYQTKKETLQRERFFKNRSGYKWLSKHGII
jgi:putative endonuclease